MRLCFSGRKVKPAFSHVRKAGANIGITLKPQLEVRDSRAFCLRVQEG